MLDAESLAAQLGALIMMEVKVEEWKWDDENKRLTEICLPPLIDDIIVKVSKDSGVSHAEVESAIVQMLISLGAVKLVEEAYAVLKPKLEKGG